jgi:hypothetical protein
LRVSFEAISHLSSLAGEILAWPMAGTLWLVSIAICSVTFTSAVTAVNYFTAALAIIAHTPDGVFARPRDYRLSHLRKLELY